MASVSPRDGKWRVLWRQGGRDGPTQSATFNTDKAAERAKLYVDAHKNNVNRDQVLSAILGIPIPDTTTTDDLLPTVAEFAETWLNSRTSLTPDTKGRYRTQLRNRILPSLGHLRLDEVTGSHLAAFVHELRADGLKAATVDRYLAVVNQLFGFAVHEHHDRLRDNPMTRTDIGRERRGAARKDNNVYLSRAEVDMIVAAAPEHARPLLVFLYETGCRWSEATALDVGDVDLFAKPARVRIWRAWKRQPDGETLAEDAADGDRWYRGAPKSGSERPVHLSRRTVDVLVALTTRARDQLLFTAPEGGRVIHSNFRSRIWLPALAAAARCELHPPAKPGPLAESACDCPTRLRQRPTLHDLRHSHVSELIALNMPLMSITRRLGHSSTAVTERVYASILPQVDDAMVAALDAAAGAAVSPLPDGVHRSR